MFGFLGKIFGTEKALDSIVDGVSSGLDKLIYTDEEKADAAAADRTEARKMVVAWMASTQGQNLARRLIALSITGAWLGLYLIGVGCSMASVFVNNQGVVTSIKVAAVGQIAKSSAGEMTSAVMLILSFYFAAPYAGEIVKKIVGKMAGNK